MVQVHSQQLYCHLRQNTRAQFESLQYLHFSFCPKTFIQYHTAIFLICFLIRGCTTHALDILIFVSVCICLNTEKLENVFTYSQYLIPFCLNGPVCIFDAWKTKRNWGKSVVKGNKYKEQMKGAEMFRGILKNPAKQRRHMNENTEFFLQKSVSNPCTSREIPDSESDTSEVGHLPFYFKN